MDDLCSVVNKELDIINEPEDGAGKLRVEVAVADSDYRRARESLDDGRELFHGIGSPPGIGQWRYGMGGISALARGTVRAVWTGGEPAVLNPEVWRSHAVTADHDNGQQQEQGIGNDHILHSLTPVLIIIIPEQ